MSQMADVAPIDMFIWERQLRVVGYRCIAGVDEVGRGALAGPLVAAAVVIPPDLTHQEATTTRWIDVKDSKTIAHRRRVTIAEWIHSSGALVSTAEVSREELDEIGLAAANRCAMERAVWTLDVEPDMLLIDAMTLDLDTPQFGIIDGDARCISIAAASIVAKVHRDAIMVELDQVYPGYGFARHKGYGVAAHLAALRDLGPCPSHRRCFSPVREAVIAGGDA
jgi:ribonuclease HII